MSRRRVIDIEWEYASGFGEALRDAMDSMEWTQGELSQRTGIDRSQLSRLQNGRTIPQRWHIEAFVDALELEWYEADTWRLAAGFAPRNDWAKRLKNKKWRNIRVYNGK